MLKGGVQGELQPEDKIIHVLLVEDDEDDVYLLSCMLNTDKRKTYDVKHCTTVGVAESLLVSSDIDVILLDLGLRETNGLDTLSRMREITQVIPIIVFTAVSDADLGEEAIQLGAADYIPKFDARASLISRAISYAIERNSLVAQLQEQAKTDSLTKLPNRLALFERLEILISHAERSLIPFSVAMMDLDGFKSINDKYGHRAGDYILQIVGERLKINLRRTDMAARLGGDEFVILITNYESSSKMLNVMKNKKDIIVAPVNVESDMSDDIEGILSEKEIIFGSSVGVVEWRQGVSAQKLISLADTAMYYSKNNGKNKIAYIQSDGEIKIFDE